jgi:hypothetical protein
LLRRLPAAEEEASGDRGQGCGDRRRLEEHRAAPIGEGEAPLVLEPVNKEAGLCSTESGCEITDQVVPARGGLLTWESSAS